MVLMFVSGRGVLSLQCNGVKILYGAILYDIIRNLSIFYLFIYLDSKYVIRLQAEGRGERVVTSDPSPGGVKYSRSRSKSVFINHASSMVSTIPALPFPLRKNILVITV